MSVILVAEDEWLVRDTVCRILSRKGYRVLAVSDGATALEVVEQSQPDLILLDIYLPVMDGRRFVRAYRERPGPHAPILVMTGKGYARERAAALGVVGHLSKPFGAKELVAKVAEVVGLHAESGQGGQGKGSRSKDKSRLGARPTWPARA